MKNVVLLAWISIFLLLAMVTTPVIAQSRVVGVHESDWFTYGNIVVNWSSNDPNATFPQSWKDFNDTEWYRITVTEIYDTTIDILAVSHYKNGTERESPPSAYIDIGSGIGGHVLIGANLSVGDPVYIDDVNDFWINETIVQNYPEGIREVNHMNMSVTQDGYWASLNLYWDRLTGVLVENNFEATNQTGEYITTYSILFSLIESNVWIVPEFPSWISMLLMLIVLTVAIAIYKRRLLNLLDN